MFVGFFGPQASITQPPRGNRPPLVVKLQQGSLFGQSVVTGKQHSLQVDSGVEEPWSRGDLGQIKRRDGVLRRQARER